MISLEEAATAGCKACGSPGGGCQFLGTAATSQVVAEALGMTVPHAALAPSGQPVWLDLARQSAKVLWDQHHRKAKLSDILCEDSFHNAIAVHAACGGSTNLLLHIPAVAFAAGIPRPSLEMWSELNRKVARFVDVLPNGPQFHPTIRLFLAGGVPEIMWHLRELGVAKCDCKTVTGLTWHQILDQWKDSPRRKVMRELLKERDGVDPDDVILPPSKAASMGMTSTICFPRGNIAPEGSVIKSTAIDSSVVDADGLYRKIGPARVFTSEKEAVAAAKGQHPNPLKAGDIAVLIGCGPMGTGMEETYQLTSALRYLEYGKHVAVITDARFSGVSTGACIGHIGPEALAGGPIGKLKDGDTLRIVIDRKSLHAEVDFIGCDGKEFTAEEGAAVLAQRPTHLGLAADPRLPVDTQLWAALQRVSGGTWGGCVYDPERIIEVLEAGMKALK
jgi:putative YjhG/YagF family dehydratase